MYCQLVLRLGLNPEYVLDKMTMYEVRAIMRHSHLKEQEQWEQTRLLAYMTAQVNSTKKLKFTDIVKFPWEEEEKEKHTEQQMNDAELKRLKAKAEATLKMINQ